MVSMTKRRLAWTIAAAVFAVFVAFPVAGALVYLKLNEDRLVFQSDRSLRWTGLPAAPPPGVQQVLVPAPGGEPLHGYTVTPEPGRALGFWVLHLHGNADSVFSGTQLRNMERLREQGFDVLAIDYRGFGPSPGKPSEQGLYDSTEAAWQWLLAKGVPPERIIIWGHSLGSGPAVKLATEQRAAALVTFGAFTSIPDMAVSRYSRLPIRWIVGVHLDSLQRMPRLRTPVVVAHCLTDRTIPYSHAPRLFAAAPEPKRLLTLTQLEDDRYGGHVTSLYEQLDRLMPLLRELAGVGRGAPQ